MKSLHYINFKFKGIFVVTFLAVFAMSCEKENVVFSERGWPTDDYFPLMKGNKWIYKGSVIEVKEVKEINNKEYFELVSQTIVADTVFHSYQEFYRKTEDGKVFVWDQNEKKEILKYNFKAPVNSSWTYPEDDMGHYWKVTKISNTVRLKIGNLQIPNCMKFDYDLIQAVDDEHTIILAPGVGKIISQSYAWGVADTLRSAIINGIEYKVQ